MRRSTLYEKPIQLTLKQNERVDLKTIEVLPNGRKSYIYAATILGRDYLQPTELTEKRPGVTYAFSMPLANGTGEPLLVSGETRATGFQQFARFGDLKQPFTVSFDGFINIPVDGVYEFQTDSIWNARVTIDGEKLIDSTGTKDRAVTSAVVPLKSRLSPHQPRVRPPRRQRGLSRPIRHKRARPQSDRRRRAGTLA